MQQIFPIKWSDFFLYVIWEIIGWIKICLIHKEYYLNI